MRVLSVLVPCALVFVALVGADLACTPKQRADVRTALDVQRCTATVSLRFIDAGEDMTDPFVLSRLAAAMTDECAPLLVAGQDGG